MRVTLSLRELPELKDKGATYVDLSLSSTMPLTCSTRSYQPPLKRKMSKSAKTRAKKREKKANDDIAPIDEMVAEQV